MREIINYMVEANIALLLFLASYHLFLRKETNFRMIRFFLLTGIFVSVTVPFLHLDNTGQVAIPAISQVIPQNWLPEIVITPDGSGPFRGNSAAIDYWRIAGWIYTGGVIFFLAWLAIQLSALFTVRAAAAYRVDRLRVVESNEDGPTFSFFNFVYIGRAHELSPSEKEQVIRHEAVHARQLHSLDILLITILRTVFWFNPFLTSFKTIFIQLHEFEADARAVGNSDVNNYCSLLARVALQSLHIPIASHFNQSLTIKRIEMMRTIKKKIRPWKVAAIAAIIPVTFFVVACQDQVAEFEKSTVSQTSDYPPEVKAHMDAYLKDHPDAKLTYVDGIPEEIDRFTSAAHVQNRVIRAFDIKEDGIVKKGVLLADVVQHADQLQTEEKVYMIVEQQPEYPGGFDALKEFLKTNMRYPKDAADAGITGTVYVSMVIGETGAVTDVKVLRGISPSMDAEAVRVISLLPTWIPGRQNGKAVNVRFTVPIRFGNGTTPTGAASRPDGATIDGIQPANYAMRLTDFTTESGNGQAILRGRLLGENGQALSGVNVILMGSSTGTATDSRGNFSLTVNTTKGKLAFSSIGFESQVVDFDLK